MVSVSIGLRLRVEVEALNMVEALGAYNRHRTVSLLKSVTKNGRKGYRLVIAPAISSQSIANGYHRVLVELANKLRLPVCDECKSYELRGGFTKRTTTKEINHDERLKTCVVEDLTGFLAPDANVRRTSPVSFSYMVPDVESAKTALDSQFHVRYDFTTREHAPFTIESGTAIYMLSISVDFDRIGRYENGEYVENREKRIELALKGLAVLIEGLNYGAKKARYLPINEVVGGIAAVSHPMPFAVSPPRVYRDGRNYIVETIERAKHYITVLQDLNQQIKLYYLDKERVAEGTPAVAATPTTSPPQTHITTVAEGTPAVEGITVTPTPVNTFSEMIKCVLNDVKEFYEIKSKGSEEGQKCT